MLPSLCGRDPQDLDHAQITRAVVESVAENTSDAIVAPLIWGALAGPSGMSGYRAVNTLDAMAGHHSPRYERFGRASARLDDVANWVPARITALLAAACSPAVGGRPRPTWQAPAPATAWSARLGCCSCVDGWVVPRMGNPARGMGGILMLSC